MKNTDEKYQNWFLRFKTNIFSGIFWCFEENLRRSCRGSRRRHRAQTTKLHDSQGTLAATRIKAEYAYFTTDNIPATPLKADHMCNCVTFLPTLPSSNGQLAVTS